MTNLLSTKFWFTIYPPDLSPISIKMYIGLITLLIVVSFLIKITITRSKERLHRRLLRKFQTLNVSNIIILLILFFLMYETVPFLSGRFWLLFLVLGNAIWLFYIYRFYSVIPSKKQEREKEEQYNKYIP